MRAPSYPTLFGLAVVFLAGGAIYAFSRLDLAPSDAGALPALLLEDTASTSVVTAPIAPTVADYERYAADDSAWRERYAPRLSLAQIRARGDGRRTPRQALQDRVYSHTKQGRRGAAIAELETWVKAHPRDEDAILWLARLLNDAGRTNDSIKRYRQLLALQEAGR